MPTPRAYYNEFDVKAAAWLRELVKNGHIAPGDVDTRSITDVQPADLEGYTQCHFFAGIGGWSYALRLAGWPDDRPVWTGSCPCQPFSAAGKRGGTDDARHLWPQFYRLIGERQPATVFGEQVASKDGLAWLDIVSTDLERANYAVGAADLCAAGVGAPHIRQRLYFVADRAGSRFHTDVPLERTEAIYDSRQEQLERRSAAGELAHSSSTGLEERRLELARQEQPTAERGGEACELGDASGTGSGRDGGGILGAETEAQRSLRGFADKLIAASYVDCRDGKRRPIEPGTFPLAHGISGRVGLLRGYGNAIVPQVAAEFIGAYLDIAG
jgi:DNA (cytosine-5)-methyltransferase 1